MADQVPYIRATDAQENARRLLDWREVVAIVVERAWLGLAVAVLVVLAFWYSAYRQTPYYRSMAMVMVEVQVPAQALGFQDFGAPNLRSIEYFNTHLKALHSRQMMEAALTKSGLDRHPHFLATIQDDTARAEAALRLVTISPIERSRLIEISAIHSDPEIAATLANALARSYIQQDLDNRMNASMQAVDWLRARSDEYRVRLEEGLLALQQYREQTESVSLEEDQNIVIAQLKSLNASLSAVQTDRIAAETAWQSLQDQLEADIPLTEIPQILEHAAVQTAYQRWSDQEREMESLRQRYRPGHPDYQAGLEQLENAKIQLDQASRRARDAIRSRYLDLVRREQNVREALRAQEQAAFDLDRKLVRYNELRRNVDADREVYEAVLARMKEASLAGTIPSEFIRVVEEARPARAPFRPNPQRALVRGGSLGIVLGFMAIFIVYYADHRFKRTEEVERALGVPVLGTLPLIHEKEFEHRGLIAHFKDNGEVAESFRTLRASLVMKSQRRDMQCLMVTSTHSGEGKSLVATNLAISMAQDGRKTLLVGGDLRRPSLHKLFKPEVNKGLVPALEGRQTWQDSTFKSAVPNLSILAAGTIPSRPAELLGQGHLQALLDEARDAYDQIILDAPPILGISDGLILMPYCDAILFVVRYGVTHSVSARYAMQKIEASGTRCIGAVMNGVNLRSMANYYYYRRYGDYTYARAGENDVSTRVKESAIR